MSLNCGNLQIWYGQQSSNDKQFDLNGIEIWECATETSIIPLFKKIAIEKTYMYYLQEPDQFFAFKSLFFLLFIHEERALLRYRHDRNMEMCYKNINQNRYCKRAVVPCYY